MTRPIARRSHARRGAVLIVVLAMLVLFAVLGLSFVLYSEAQLSAARSQKLAANQETEPNPQAAAEGYLGGLIYDVGDTGDDLMNPIRGHSLARSKYGYQAGQGNLLPYFGNVAFNDLVNFNGFTNGRLIVRHTWDKTNGNVFDPERWGGGTGRNDPTAALPGKFYSKSIDFTYPDRHDYYLAFQDPTTGEVVLPSFHRPELGNWIPGDPNNFENQAGGKFKTLRPLAIAGEHPNFPKVPPNADGTYTGDVQNMTYTAGVQHNDSLWMDVGGPVLKWRGKQYKACVAPLVLDLNGRVNVSVAGNLLNRPTDAARPHGGSQGWGPWEVNPMALGLSAADQQAVVQRRSGKTGIDFTPPADPYTAALASARLNGGRVPPNASLIDADGVGPVTNDGPLALPASAANGGHHPFPSYNHPLAAAPYRFSPTQADLTNTLANHPSQFNPLAYARQPSGATPGGFGHDDLLKLLARYSDPKGRHAALSGVPAGTGLTPAADTPAARLRRATTTPFSVTQQWSSVLVKTAAGYEVLGPIDVNRPLPDFRKNPALPPSPANLWDPAVAAEAPNYYRALTARHTLARDIFIRLLGVGGFVDNFTYARYDSATGGVVILPPDNSPRLTPLVELAQAAVNIVDYIDGDDLVTAFAWRPTAASLTASPGDPTLHHSNFAAVELPKRVVFGTELPRLVINEAYSGVFNTRDDPFPGAMPRASRPLKERHWLELHNPTPPEPASSPARADAGAARLVYQNGVTQVTNPVTLATGNYTGVTFNPYRIEVADMPTPATGTSRPYGDALFAAGSGAVGSDTALTPGMTLRARVDTYAHDATAPSAAATLTGDALNVVLPTTAASGGNGRNQGYYLIGPRDQYPAGGVTNTLSLADPPAGVPTAAAPVDALTFDVTTAAPAEADIAAAAGLSHVFILRRLSDPYRPLNDPTVPAGPFPYDSTKPVNLFITVDYMEKMPTRDRATHSTSAANRPASDAPSQGRIHPYLANSQLWADDGIIDANDIPPGLAVRDQVNAAATPPHTLFGVNNPADTTRGAAPNTYGFEWLVHLDRELISLPELYHVSAVSPAALTQSFFGAAKYHAHTLNSVMGANLLKRSGPLEVGSRLPGVPLGGREPGRVNINTVNHPTVVDALFGRTEGSQFSLTNPSQVTDVWNHLSPATPPLAPLIARTPNRVPRATFYEGGSDQPLIWGSSDYFSTDVARTAAKPYFRRTVAGVGFTGEPVFRNPLASGDHPYPESEPLRKVWNNMTAVSDSFLVVMTVGFFEVENAGPYTLTNPPQLGRELHDTVPGDLRVRFAGVIDRSQLATQVVTATPTGTGTGIVRGVAADPATNAISRGVQTKLITDVSPSAVPTTVHIEAVPAGGVRPDGVTVAAGTCAVLGDGVVYTVAAGSRLRVGYGDAGTPTTCITTVDEGTESVDTVGSGDGEWLTVTAVAQRQSPDAGGVLQNVPGQAAVTVAAVTRPHAAGSPVGNVLLGNPGPQAGVTLPQLQARGLVPYFTRLDP